MTPLLPLRITEKGVARLKASEAVKHPAVKAQIEAVRRLRETSGLIPTK